jgi:2-oxoglutarate dehydrogenase E2 component (dihydrolipoamide succinyltransferase)
VSRNIGIALDLEGHLLVPVIADAQDLNLRGLSHRLADVRDRARTGELAVEDLIGGTFTVTAPVSSQVLVSIPQLIEPQVAVLSVGGIRRRPVVLTDEEGTDSIAIASIGVLGLAFDSGVVDVTTATRFLERVAELLATHDWTAEL